MKFKWVILGIFLICALLLALSYINFDKPEEELKFNKNPVFEEEGYIVKPNK